MPDKKPPFPFPPGHRPETRAERRQREKSIERLAARIESRRAAQRHSGAGYPIDELTREFVDIYNDRKFEGKHLPFSFNVLQGFLKEVQEEHVTLFELLPERDHAFLIGDFLDYATAAGPEGRGFEALRAIPEGRVLNFTPIGDVHDMAFTDPSGQQVVIGGFAMSRSGDLLNWLMIGGTVTDLAAETERLREQTKEWETHSVTLTSTATMPDYEKVRAQPLPGTDDVWKTLAYGIFNLRTRSHESRTFAHDYGTMYSMVSDDPCSLGVDSIEEMTEEQRAGYETYSKRLDEYALIFEMAETAFLLPSYFSFRIDLVREVQRPTAVGSNKVPRKDLMDVLRAAPGERPAFRKVASLDVVNLAPAQKGTRSYTPPRFSVELDGFWRRLSPASVGKDPNGNPVAGRTWVRGHMRWRDRPQRRAPVLVKASVTAARMRAAELVMADETAEVVGARD